MPRSTFGFFPNRRAYRAWMSHRAARFSWLIGNHNCRVERLHWQYP